MLGEVDFFAVEHVIDAGFEVLFDGEVFEEGHRLGGDALTGIVQEDACGFEDEGGSGRVGYEVFEVRGRGGGLGGGEEGGSVGDESLPLGGGSEGGAGSGGEGGDVVE